MKNSAFFCVIEQFPLILRENEIRKNYPILLQSKSRPNCCEKYCFVA